MIGISAASVLLLLYYYLFIFIKTSVHKQSYSQQTPACSVIIAARNERVNLENNLPEILGQDYPNFEVVVVNDGSYDGTSDLLKMWSHEYPHLKLVDLQLDERYRRGKKFALTMGIKAASHEQLLFTDADCKPASKHWIKEMMQSKGDKELVLGIAPLKHKVRLWSLMSQYETFHTALQYSSYALKGKPYMGVGRNLSYTKTLFFANKGFATHQHLMSGDDDLFVQEVATPHNVAVCLSKDSFMWSKAPKSFAAYIKQKTRHLSTGKLYKLKFKRLLINYSIAQLVWFFCLIAALLRPELYIVLLPILSLKILVQWIVMGKAALKLQMRSIAYLLPIYDLSYCLYLLIFGAIRPIAKPTQWN